MCLRSPKSGSDISDPSRASRSTATKRPTLSCAQVDDAARAVRQLREMVPAAFASRSRLSTRHENRADGRRIRPASRRRRACRQPDGRRCDGNRRVSNYPTVFSSLPLELVSHSSERVNRDLGRFAGRRVVVVGAGQSALELAALLSEAGAQVEILARQPNVRWLRSSSWLEWLMDCKVNPFKVPGKIGPIGINWLVENPRLFTAFPRRLQDKMTARAIRPAGSSWLRPRTTEVTFQTGRHVVSAMRQGDQVRLELNDGTPREPDHVLLGTGYKVSVSRISFLSADLRTDVRRKWLSCSQLGPRIHCAWIALCRCNGRRISFGPLCRFVAGTSYTASALTAFVRKRDRAALLQRPDANHGSALRLRCRAPCRAGFCRSHLIWHFLGLKNARIRGKNGNSRLLKNGKTPRNSGFFRAGPFAQLSQGCKNATYCLA